MKIVKILIILKIIYLRVWHVDKKKRLWHVLIYLIIKNIYTKILTKTNFIKISLYIYIYIYILFNSNFPFFKSYSKDNCKRLFDNNFFSNNVTCV